MKRHMNRDSQGGFSILEVVIGIFIFVVGLLALSSLQGALTRSMADAKVRATATSLAEGVIETFRGFTHLESDTAVPPAWTAYNDIVSSDTAQTVNGITYNIDTDVTDFYYDIASYGFDTTAPSGVSVSTFKQVEVNVSWDAVQNFRAEEGTDIDLGSGDIVLTVAIPALVTSASGRTASEAEGNILAPPVSYTPGLNPDIVSLSLGDNKFKESLLPEPDVTKSDELVETRFDVITYSQTGDGAQFLRREEFAVVSCDCILRSPDADNPGHRPVIWAGDEYARGQHVVKAWGEQPNNVRQSPLCEACCRDHHDGGVSVEPPDHADTAVNTYVPFKPSTEYVGSGTFAGDHKHYNRPRSGIPVEVTSAGSTYVEACRLVRVDGFFRVAQDFRREDLNIFPNDFLVLSNQVDLYSSYVTGAAADYAANTGVDYESDPPCIGDAPCEVPGPPKQGDYDAAIVMVDGNPTQLPSWTTLPLASVDTQQLRSRGIYIDYLSYDLRQVLLNCDPATENKDSPDCQSGDVYLDRTGSVNALELLPFFDVQLTKLNRWNEIPDNIPIDTTNEPLADHNAHSRGVASYSTGGESTVVATGHRGNIGFTDTLPIDPLYAAEVTDADIFVHAGDDVAPIPGVMISGLLTETVPGNIDIVVTGLHGVQCGQTSTSYHCLVPDVATNPQVQLSGYGKANTDRYACSIGTVLAADTAVEVINGTNAKAVFDLLGEVEGTTYNFVIQADACPDIPPIIGF